MDLPDFANELWVMTASGLPLVHMCKCQNDREDLFTGLVSAINDFAEEIFADQCQSIKMKTSKLPFLHSPSPEIIFLCRSEVKTLEHRVITYLNHMCDHFLEEYSEILVDWKGCMIYCY